MTNKIPSYVNNAKWDCIEKKHSRIITIIDLYKSIFKQKSIPKNSQYWSMCGAHFNKNGPITGEFGHLYKSKLINQSQYNGVDREKSIIKTNKKIYPNVNWIHGDFYDTIESMVIKDDFNPSIINYDGVMQSKYGMLYLKKILTLIDNNVSNKLMLISNFVLTNPYTSKCSSNINKFTVNETIDLLISNYLLPDHWNIYPQCYTYISKSRNSCCTMGIIIFIKKKHDINDIKFTKNRVIN